MTAQRFPEVDDPETLAAGVQRMLRQVDPDFGDTFQAMRPDYLDLGRRPGKAVSNESWFFPRSGLPYIHVASGNAGSVFHESGHGLHDYLSFRAHGSLWNFNGPEVFQEFAATSMDMLCWPYYAQSAGGLFTAADSVRARKNVMHLYLGFCATTCVLEDAFEHWVYGEAPEDVTPADLDAKWLELKERLEPWDDGYASSEDKATGWQRNTFSLFRWPLYMITYSMSMVATCQLAQLTKRDRAAAVANYKTALTLGNTRPLPALFRQVGVDFPFAEQDVADALHFVLAEARSLDNFINR